MHSMLRTALFCSALLAISAPAFAQDAAWIDPSSSTGGGGYSDPSPQVMYGGPANSWTGLYVGGTGAYGFGTLGTNAPGNPQNDLRGFNLGGQVGFNFDLGGLVIGAEADAAWSNVNYAVEVGGVVTNAYSIDYFGTARIRAGFAYNQFMPYVTAGVAAGQATSKFQILGGTFAQPNIHTGWTAGAGIEFAATQNLSVKLEYLYTDLGTQTYFQGLGTPVDATFRFGTVRIGANFKF